MSVRVARLTAPGRSALASLAVDGAAAWDLIRPLFRSIRGAEVSEPPAEGRFRLGRLGADVADEVVLARVPGGYEIHCHGGREVVRSLIEALERAGAVEVGWEELIAGALRLLPFAPTAKAARVLLDQHNGAWRDAIGRIVAALPDDRELRELAGRVPLGRHLITPWHVAVAGAPNAGKSSLVNALAGFARTVVAPTPGTTRDAVRVPLALDGWPVELIDTAGQRDASDPLEAAGIELARREAATADLVVWVQDATAEPSVAPSDALVVVNKCDLAPTWDGPYAVRVSALTGAGVVELAALIAAALVPEPPEAGAAVPYTDAQGRAVLAALAALGRGDVAAAREGLSHCSG